MLAHLAAALLATLPTASQDLPAPQEAVAPREAPPSAPADEALARLRAHLAGEAAQARQARIDAGTVLIGVGAGLSTLTLVSLRLSEENRGPFLGGVLLSSGALLAGGALQLVLHSPAERTLAELDATGGSSAERLALFEGRLQQAARDGRTLRRVFGGVAGGLGVLFLGLGAGVELNAQARGEPADANVLWMAGAGAAVAITGLGVALFGSSPAELSWERYQLDPAVDARRGPEVQLGAGPVGRDGFGLALAGRF